MNKVYETLTDSYSVQRLVGEGGAGRVFLVENTAGKPLALKVLRSASPDKLRRFRHEIAICKAISHPNIVRILDDGFDVEHGAKVPFYIMPMYGSTLRAFINESVAPSDKLGLFMQVMDGLEEVHSRQVWHRDLKPENILVEPDGKKCVVADFGVAHIAQDLVVTNVQTEVGVRLANFGYAAPEQRARGAKVGPSADVFALGLILYELLTGVLAHGVDFDLISESLPEYGYLDKVIRRMLHARPEARYQTISDLRLDLSVRARIQDADRRQRVLRRQDIPGQGAMDVLPIEIVGVDYRDGALIMELDRIVEPELERVIQAGKYSHHSLRGSEPGTIRIDGRIARVPLSNPKAAKVVRGYFKEYLAAGIAEYRARLLREAEKKDLYLRQKREQEIEAERTREEVLRQLSE